MALLQRAISSRIDRTLQRGKSILLLGPRQTGKTTLMQEIKADLFISLIEPSIRLAYERAPDRLIREVEALPAHKKSPPLIIIDEVQKVPRLMDAAQYLIDSKKAQFILTGSSARKLRRDGDVNLLPGRVVALRMDPLMLNEMRHPLPPLEALLINGALPGIYIETDQLNIDEDLASYVSTYLEEEVRAEALVRNMGSFSQFLKLAAIDSGNEINFEKLSQAIGVSSPTIKSYYEILVDCLIAERIEPLAQSKTRKRLIKSPKFLIYDLGVRRIAAREQHHFPEKYLGKLFEQWVGLELIRLLRQQPEKSELLFWRDANGPEIDFVIEHSNRYIPMEVKWTDNPKPHDARHLLLFLNEYKNTEHAYVICRVTRRQKLSENIFAIPWQDISELFETI